MTVRRHPRQFPSDCGNFKIPNSCNLQETLRREGTVEATWTSVCSSTVGPAQVRLPSRRCSASSESCVPLKPLCHVPLQLVSWTLLHGCAVFADASDMRMTYVQSTENSKVRLKEAEVNLNLACVTAMHMRRMCATHAI